MKTILLYPRKDLRYFGAKMKTIRQCRYNGENEDWKGWKMNLCYVKSKKFCKENRNIEYDTMILILNRLGIITSYICYGNPLTLKELTVHHVCDISYRMIQSKIAFYSDATEPYIYDTISWFVPAPNLIPIQMFPVKVFSAILWILFISTLVFFGITWYTIRSVHYKPSSMFVVQQIVKMLNIFLEQSASYRTRYLSEMILVLLSLYFVFLMNAVYKTRFFFLLTGIEFEEPITSFQDIIKRNMKTGIPWSEVPKNLRHNNDKIFRESIDCHTSKICLDRVANQRDLAILTLDRIGDQLHNSYVDVDGRPLIQRLDPPYISVHIVAFLPKGHPFLLKLNRYLRDLMNFGILPKIISKYESKFSEIEWKTSGPYKLKVEHLKAPNVLLLIGLSLSVLTFIWELLKARILRKEMRLSLDI
ncbi:hypothetical protein HHI36_015667 [Cryptolaemus montrouzieri]|uniref:Ionotropic receptor n=1 Tax=Cryptolaemus montrouzieri TaxID=559131 RepID=A0ABD2N694_9CUCU